MGKRIRWQKKVEMRRAAPARCPDTESGLSIEAERTRAKELRRQPKRKDWLGDDEYESLSLLDSSHEICSMGVV